MRRHNFRPICAGLRALFSLAALFALCLTLAFPTMPLLGNTAVAEPAPQAGQDPVGDGAPMSDADFAQSQIGKSYTGSLNLDDWDGLGGGLVSPPIYVHQFERGAAMLILTAMERAPAAKGAAARFEVTDALLIDKTRKGYTVSTTCMKGDDYTLRFLAEVSGKDASEMWTNVRKAWEIDLETGKIAPTKTRGVKCTNPNW